MFGVCIGVRLIRIHAAYSPFEGKDFFYAKDSNSRLLVKRETFLYAALHLLVGDKSKILLHLPVLVRVISCEGVCKLNIMYRFKKNIIELYKSYI